MKEEMLVIPVKVIAVMEFAVILEIGEMEFLVKEMEFVVLVKEVFLFQIVVQIECVIAVYVLRIYGVCLVVEDLAYESEGGS